MIVFKFGQAYIKNDQNLKDSKYVLTFSIASAFAESLTILWYLTRQKWQNIALFLLQPGGRNWQQIYPN
jgi:hypothetical protein